MERVKAEQRRQLSRHRLLHSLTLAWRQYTYLRQARSRTRSAPEKRREGGRERKKRRRQERGARSADRVRSADGAPPGRWVHGGCTEPRPAAPPSGEHGSCPRRGRVGPGAAHRTGSARAECSTATRGCPPGGSRRSGAAGPCAGLCSLGSRGAADWGRWTRPPGPLGRA